MSDSDELPDCDVAIARVSALRAVSSVTPSRSTAQSLAERQAFVELERTLSARAPIVSTSKTPSRRKISIITISSDSSDDEKGPDARCDENKPDACSDENVIGSSSSSSSLSDGVLHWPGVIKPTPKKTPQRRPLSSLVSTPSASTPTATPKPRPTPTPRTRKKVDPKSFVARRDDLVAQLTADLDDNVFGGRLPANLTIEWAKRLTTTAGQASLKAGQYTIRLSDKVVDSDDRLRNTLSHELCHVMSWAVEREMKPPHGPAFVGWARKIMAYRSDIKVTTTHRYEIAHAYRWRCEGCTMEIGRHSKSIDVSRQACGACRGTLKLVAAPGRTGKKLAEEAEELARSLEGIAL